MPAAFRPWLFRAALLSVNIVGLIWIHHDLTAGSRPRLRVISALPSQDADSSDRLTFIFDRPLSLAGAPGRVLAESPFSIVPAVAGTWRWSAPERLEYCLDKPLPPGRRFTARAAAALEQLTGEVISGQAEFQFQTRRLQVLTCDLASCDREHANIELQFNQPVNPDDLARHLRVHTAEGSSVSGHVLTKAPAEKLAVRLRSDGAERLLLSIDAALTGNGAELALSESVRRELDLRPAFAIVKAEAEPAELEPNTCVNIRFSKALEHKETTATPRVKVTPPVDRLQVRAEDANIALSGAFESGRRYTATFEPDLRAADKETLGSGTSASFDIPDRKPALRFGMRSGVLSPNGNLLVDLKLVNISTLNLHSSRVHANNLVAHLRGDHRQHTSRDLPEKTVSVDAPRNVPTTVSVDLRELLRQPLGIYRIQASGPEDSWTEDSVVVAVTDLAVTSKAERGGFCIWVTSLRTARSVAGAEVNALSYNGQVLATAVTDSSGIARLAVPAEHPDGKAWAITARSGDDLTFLLPDERPWMLDNVEQAGRATPTSYDVMLYTERGVYRPGEVVHLTGIVRDISGGTPTPFPMTVSVRRPDGKEVAQLPVKPESQGVFQVDYATADQARTGPYRFKVTLPGSREILGESEALVEEYVPLRLEVKADPARSRFGPGDAVSVRVQARYLFEQAAEGLSVKLTGEYRPDVFTSKRFPTFHFEAERKSEEVSIGDREAQLDAAGHATIAIDSPPAESACWRASLVATVTEPGGHSVSKPVECVVDLKDRHVGLRLPGGRLAAVGSPFPVEWVQVTGNDALAEPGPAGYVLSRVEQDTTLQEVDGRLVWKTREQVTAVSQGELTVPSGEAGQFNVTCPAPGLYRLRLTDCYSGAIADIDFRAAEEQDEAYASALNHPEQLDIALDKDTYAPGSIAHVLVKSPFAGTLLVTLETDRVIESRVLEMTAASAQAELPVSDALRGGAFVTATVVRRVDPTDRNWLPHRAMGMARLRTDMSQHGLAGLQILAPQQARPGQTLPVKVQLPAPPDAQKLPVVHLWAVDEGILLATDYTTPRPERHFFAERRAEVASADIFGNLLPDHQRPSGTTRIGGDGCDEDGEYARRLNPVPGPRRAPMVIWRKVMPVGADGALTADMLIPEFTGAIRVMAVVVDGDRYGSAEQKVPVTSPLLIEASWPRFAAPEDRFEVPAKLFNTTPEPLQVTMVATADGPLQLEVPQPQEGIRVAADGSATVWLRARANGLGAVTVSLHATAKPAAGEVLACSQEGAFAIRPAGPLHSNSRLVCIKAGEPFKMDPAAEFLPGTAKTALSLSARPGVQLQPVVEQLLDYPYGCVEQTTSQMYVLLYAPDLLPAASADTARRQNLNDMLQAGLARLWSMQTRSGGLSYWPGDSEPTLWGSAYVAEFLVRAKVAGRKFDASFASDLAKYLQAELDHPSDEQMDDNLRAHICCALASLQKPPQGWMSRLSERIEHLDMAGRAHLAAAWLAAGRKDRASAALAPGTLDQSVATTTGGRLTSQVQQQAVLLNTLLDLDHNHPWIPALVQRLEKARQGGRWRSTLENASALAALARYQLAAGKEESHFQGTVRQSAAEWSFDDTAVRTLTVAADQPLEIASTGQGSIYLSLTTRGLLREATTQEYDRQLIAARKWTTRDGKPVDLKKIKVGDLILVETTLQAPSAGDDGGIENVALVDALPGGLEVENPRIRGGSGEGGEDDPAALDRVEFRDDRVVIFASAGTEKSTFRYALRAITAGSFALPPIQAECMYDSGFASLHGSGRVEISR